MRGLLVGIYVSPNLRSPCRVCNHTNKTTVDDTAPRIVKRLAVRPCSSGVIATMEPFHFDAVVPVPSLSRDGGGPRVFAPAPAFGLRWIIPAAGVATFSSLCCYTLLSVMHDSARLHWLCGARVGAIMVEWRFGGWRDGAPATRSRRAAGPAGHRSSRRSIHPVQ